MARLSDPYSWAGKVKPSGGKLSPNKMTNPFTGAKVKRGEATPGEDNRPETKGKD